MKYLVSLLCVFLIGCTHHKHGQVTQKHYRPPSVDTVWMYDPALHILLPIEHRKPAEYILHLSINKDTTVVYTNPTTYQTIQVGDYYSNKGYER